MATSNPVGSSLISRRQITVPKLYQSVIDDVVTNVREAFLDDGVDEQILQELRQLWENKLNQSKAVDSLAVDSKHLVGQYAKQQQQLLQQKQQQQSAAAAVPTTAAPRQVARAVPTQQTSAAKPATVTSGTVAANTGHVAVSTSQQVQLPQFINQAGQFEVSGAAAQAHNALGGLIPGGTVTLQTPNGPMQFIIQAPAQQHQSGTVTLPAGVITTQHLGQVDGQDDSLEENQSSEASSSASHPNHGEQSDARVGHQVDGLSDSRLGPQVERPSDSRLGHQVDGQNDTSSDEDDDDDDDDNDDDQNDDEDGADEEEEDPLNSDDDVSEDDPAELFDTDNVVVCQFDKINRAKNRWKFHLKDGIMNLNGRDLVFQKCTGDAEW